MRVAIIDRSTNPYARELVRGLRANGVDVIHVGAFGNAGALEVLPRSARGAHMSKARDILVGMPRLLRAVRTFRPDVVHLQWPTFFEVLAARIALRVARARFVYTAHNPTATRAGRRQVRLVAHADAVIVHGERLRDDLLGHYPNLCKARVKVIPHGNYNAIITRHDKEEARRRLGVVGGPVYTFVGQLRSRKGVDVLVDAFARLGEGVLVICGAATDERYAEMVRRLADRVGVDPVWLVSVEPAPQHVVDLAVSAADQIVLPFLDASQSGSAILGMSYGKCVVASAVGEIPELLEGRGLLVPPRDVDSLVAAMEVAVSDPARCERLGTAASTYVKEELAWERIASRTVEVYQSVRGEGTPC